MDLLDAFAATAGRRTVKFVSGGCSQRQMGGTARFIYGALARWISGGFDDSSPCVGHTSLSLRRPDAERRLAKKKNGPRADTSAPHPT